MYLNHTNDQVEPSNFNFMLEEFGMFVNQDAVIRTHYDGKYFHPKEAVVVNGILNRELSKALNQVASNQSNNTQGTAPVNDDDIR